VENDRREAQRPTDDYRLARPVSITDLWDIDDRITQLEAVTQRLENIVLSLEQLYREERIKNWELILREMLRQRGHDEYRTSNDKYKTTNLK